MASPAMAAAPEFGLPIDCEIGETCWMVNLVDHDPGPGFADYRCGSLGYDGHRGTDIALANMAHMKRGVAVIAAAPGEVRAVRDGMPATTPADMRNPETLKGRECGNGVVVEHGNGWSSQYCHLKAGSIIVSGGTRVEAGQPLGEVGLSGMTEFPHVHFVARKDGTVIDPFNGRTQASACGASTNEQPLWSRAAAAALGYPGPQLYHLGFTVGKPDLGAVRAGRATQTTFPVDAPALVFWAEVFSVKKGDKMTLVLAGPDGEIISRNTVEIDRPQARRYGFVGRKKRGAGWAKGTYRGRVGIMRDGKMTLREAIATVE